MVQGDLEDMQGCEAMGVTALIEHFFWLSVVKKKKRVVWALFYFVFFDRGGYDWQHVKEEELGRRLSHSRVLCYVVRSCTFVDELVILFFFWQPKNGGRH